MKNEAEESRARRLNEMYSASLDKTKKPVETPEQTQQRLRQEYLKQEEKADSDIKKNTPGRMPSNALHVKIVDFDMPFRSLVVFMVKVAIAAVPAGIIVALLWTAVAGFLRGLIN